MAYVEGRVVHDADSHIMEAPNFLDGYVEERYAESIRRKHMFSLLGEKSGKDLFAVVRGRHDDPKWRAEAADQILLRKNYEALGSWRREDRPSALDSLGFASQLMFTTMFLGLLNLEHEGDPVMRNAVARGFNRAMVDFCAVDRRLLASCYVPLADFDEAAAISREAISIGAKALLIPSRCPKGHSPSHIGFDPVWAQAQEAGLPILFHVGGGGPLLSKDYFVNGLPPVPDFHGGDGNFRSVDYMAIPFPPMQTLATMIFDRVLDRFPRLKFGVHRAGRLMAARMDAIDGFRPQRIHQERGAAEKALATAERVCSAPGPRDALSRRGHWLDHRELRRRDLHVLVGLSPRRRRAQSDQALRGNDARDARAGQAALLLRQLRRPDGQRHSSRPARPANRRLVRSNSALSHRRAAQESPLR